MPKSATSLGILRALDESDDLVIDFEYFNDPCPDNLIQSYEAMQHLQIGDAFWDANSHSLIIVTNPFTADHYFLANFDEDMNLLDHALTSFATNFGGYYCEEFVHGQTYLLGRATSVILAPL